jgi:hypothetical protein
MPRAAIESHEVTNTNPVAPVLERAGHHGSRPEFIRRVPGAARSITLIVPPESLPALKRIER